MTKAMKIFEYKHNLSNTHAADRKLCNTNIHPSAERKFTICTVQGNTADQRKSTTNSTNIGPCKLTTQMLKHTADQKTRIAVNIIVGRT